MTTGMTLRITRPGFITPACSRGNEGGGWWIVVVVRQRAVRFWQGQRGRMDGWTVGTVVVVRQRAVRVSVWSIRHVVRPQQQEIHPGPTTPPLPFKTRADARTRHAPMELMPTPDLAVP